jgi:branched-chain amino acid transport system ATP-binding protein
VNHVDVNPSRPEVAPFLLDVRGLDKRFGGLHATDHVSFQVGEGRLVALIGPNGAGKTTLFNLITNLIAPNSGEVRLAGRSLKGLSQTRIAALGLIRTFQTARVFPGLTVLENALAGRHRLMRAGLAGQMLWWPRQRREEADARRRAEGLLEMVGLARYRDVHAVELPMGAQKMLEVIRALMARPRILLLDEPAAGLNDTETAELASLLRAIRDSGITVVLVEHNMPLVMGIADHVLVIDAGRLIMSGRPDEVRRDPRVIEAYLGRDEGLLHA